MRIRFGWHLDGARWPDTLDGAIHGLGDAVVGPEGLLGLLESCLGLGRPEVPSVLRVAQFLARLRAVNDGARFFSASLAADGWAVDRLWRVLATRWPGAGWRCELPVQGRLGLQRVSGRIDLLVDAGAGWVIFDHKAFPGPHERWGERALEHAPQLALYARLVAEASGRPVLGCFIHMPVVGRLLEVG